MRYWIIEKDADLGKAKARALEDILKAEVVVFETVIDAIETDSPLPDALVIPGDRPPADELDRLMQKCKNSTISHH